MSSSSARRGVRPPARTGGQTSVQTPLVPPLVPPLHTGAGDRRAEGREEEGDYYRWRNYLATHLRWGTRPYFDAAEILEWSEHLGVPQVQAAEWLENFIADVARHRARLRTRAAG